jgi:hypothetical protein
MAKKRPVPNVSEAIENLDILLSNLESVRDELEEATILLAEILVDLDPNAHSGQLGI